jgi:hypothetical protein
MRKIDAEVLALNEYVAWVEKEGMVYDLRSKEFIQKSNFTNGSRYSALETFSATAKGTGLKRISISEAWLKHPHAQRYDYVEFRPEDSSAVLTTGAGGLALNMWTGWRPEPGDVKPFLDLSEFLFSELREHADLPLKLLAYKAQNPGIKVPLAPVLVGPQGGGKSLWAECVRDAFAPYTAEIPSSALGSQFNGWTERTLIAVINEASGEALQRVAPTLRALISDKRTMLNDKFRLARQIDSYTMYIITSNDRGAGAYSADDRRMIVVNCPPKREPPFYRSRCRVEEPRRRAPSAALSCCTMDLKGWQPPACAHDCREVHGVHGEPDAYPAPGRRDAHGERACDRSLDPAGAGLGCAGASSRTIRSRFATRRRSLTLCAPSRFGRGTRPKSCRSCSLPLHRSCTARVRRAHMLPASSRRSCAPRALVTCSARKIRAASAGRVCCASI